MTPERWKRLRAAIEAALEASSPAQREAALAQACAEDPTLLSEARSIMRAAGEGDDLLESSPTFTSEGGDAETRPTLLGRRLGHYQIEQRLGAGGMGEVFRARDLALGRESALKVLPRRVLQTGTPGTSSSSSAATPSRACWSWRARRKLSGAARRRRPC